MPKSQFTEGYKVFIAALIKARKDAGLTQVELGGRIGRKQTHISIIETGVRRIDVIEFTALAKAMGHDPVTLYARICAALPERLEI